MAAVRMSVAERRQRLTTVMAMDDASFLVHMDRVVAESPKGKTVPVIFYERLRLDAIHAAGAVRDGAVGHHSTVVAMYREPLLHLMADARRRLAMTPAQRACEDAAAAAVVGEAMTEMHAEQCVETLRRLTVEQGVPLTAQGMPVEAVERVRQEAIAFLRQNAPERLVAPVPNDDDDVPHP